MRWTREQGPDGAGNSGKRSSWGQMVRKPRQAEEEKSNKKYLTTQVGNLTAYFSRSLIFFS